MSTGPDDPGPTAQPAPPVPVAPTLVPPPDPTPLTLDRQPTMALVPARFALRVERPGIFCLSAIIADPDARQTRVVPLVMACGGADGSGPFVDMTMYGELTLARFGTGDYVILVRHPDPDRSGTATVKAWRADPARPAVGQPGANP